MESAAIKDRGGRWYGSNRREEGVLEGWSVGRLFLPLESLQDRKENCLCKESMAHWCGRVDVRLVVGLDL